MQSYIRKMYEDATWLAFDLETTSRHKGSYFGATPYDPANLVVMGGFYGLHDSAELEMYEILPNVWNNMMKVGSDGRSNIVLVGCNIGFDLSWVMTRLPPEWEQHRGNILVWDISVAHYLMCGQAVKYPSMDMIAAYWKLPVKPDTLKRYMDDGIDVDAIPKEELFEYLRHDLVTTREIALNQLEYFEGDVPDIYLIRMDDILMTTEMQVNGMRFSSEISGKLAEDSLPILAELEENLASYALSCIGKDVGFNAGSPSQLASFLYGGEFRWVVTEVVHDTLGKPVLVKSGKSKGSVKTKKVEKTLSFAGVLPQAIIRAYDSRTTDEERLISLQEKTQVAGLEELSEWLKALLRARTLRKDISTYYHGYQAFAELDGFIHTNLNQTGTVTGRLSSSSPNLQNAAHSTED